MLAGATRKRMTAEARKVERFRELEEIDTEVYEKAKGRLDDEQNAHMPRRPLWLL